MSSISKPKDRSYHHVIYRTLASAPWTESIRVPFPVSTMNVHYAHYYKDGTETGSCLIRCRALVGGNAGILTVITDSTEANPGTRFTINGPVDSDFQFEPINMDGTLVGAGTRTGDLVIDLEFFPLIDDTPTPKPANIKI